MESGEGGISNLLQMTVARIKKRYSWVWFKSDGERPIFHCTSLITEQLRSDQWDRWQNDNVNPFSRKNRRMVMLHPWLEKCFDYY